MSQTYRQDWTQMCLPGVRDGNCLKEGLARWRVRGRASDGGNSLCGSPEKWKNSTCSRSSEEASVA